mmetsp:Transcript_1370/g.1918  ORF Transcript_1370/g.1918 Transcript_1370/m.1918 type:complete len:81 (-) Transcript_1370:85-327(-)
MTATALAIPFLIVAHHLTPKTGCNTLEGCLMVEMISHDCNKKVIRMCLDSKILIDADIPLQLMARCQIISMLGDNIKRSH